MIPDMYKFGEHLFRHRSKSPDDGAPGPLLIKNKIAQAVTQGCVCRMAK